MKTKWLWIAMFAVLVIALGVLLGGKLVLQSPGIRVFGGELYVDVSGTAYAFDDKTKEFLNVTQVNVDGYTAGTEIFEGTLSVQGFPITEGGTISGDPVVIDAGEGFYYIEYLPMCTHMETTENGEREYPVKHMCDYSYTYCVYPEDPDFLAVIIYDSVEAKYYVVVLAEDQAQAESRYQWFLEHEPSLYD